MSEKPNKVDIEMKKILVIDWISNFEKTGKVDKIDVSILKEVFVYHGADFEHNSETLAPLSKYTNKAKRSGLNAVWEKKSVDDFWNQIDLFIEQHESTTKKELPKLKKSGYKFSGMRQFFGEITALSAGLLSLEKFKEYSETRIFNGRMWSEDRKDERIRISVPTKDKPILLSSYPPEYPHYAISTILSKNV